MINLVVLDKFRYEKMLKEKPLTISYAFESTQFGRCLIGFINNKLCYFSFIGQTEDKTFESFKKHWPKASFVNDPESAKSLLEEIFKEDVTMEVMVRGTPFQEKVWRALLDIKKGETRYYGDVAVAVGCPTGQRAVANAIARNPVSYLVPCHRVISKVGDIYKYGGGCITKKKLLMFEGFKE